MEIKKYPSRVLREKYEEVREIDEEIKKIN